MILEPSTWQNIGVETLHWGRLFFLKCYLASTDYWLKTTSWKHAWRYPPVYHSSCLPPWMRKWSSGILGVWRCPSRVQTWSPGTRFLPWTVKRSKSLWKDVSMLPSLVFLISTPGGETNIYPCSIRLRRADRSSPRPTANISAAVKAQFLWYAPQVVTIC